TDCSEISWFRLLLLRLLLHAASIFLQAAFFSNRLNASTERKENACRFHQRNSQTCPGEPGGLTLTWTGRSWVFASNQNASIIGGRWCPRRLNDNWRAASSE